MRRPDPSGRPTIVKIAAALDISPSTVSRAFTRPELLHPDTVAAVKAHALEVGYVPNQLARGLVSGRANAIGIVLPDIANPFFPPLIRSIQHTAHESGLSVFIADSADDAGREQELIHDLGPQVHGIINISSRMASRDLQRLAESHNIVLINRDIADMSRVLVDTAPAIAQAVEQLTALGHHHLAYVGGPKASWSNASRSKAVIDAGRRHGVIVDTYDTRLGSYDEAWEATHALVATGATAAIAFDDVMAHGLLNGFAARGVRTPEDISIVGCDDTLATKTQPELTTIAANLDETARTATNILLAHRGRSRVAATRGVQTAQLLPGGSVGPATAVAR
ncbi:LacI family DNA-binding transcriptional regulator [Glaciihabitans sp. dw_435]|uniref:LacI family DNA-binding transcriptional regulator n=1 Tax=Glaciihabitans sp. dw_435 TaxID=2720081 RepID=UPI001BD1F12D|nr:LacI family DNA-binding transcriptional regulator [Glaciihabitans sp. dw_435]